LPGLPTRRIGTVRSHAALVEVATTLTAPVLAVVGATVVAFLVRYALVTFVSPHVVTGPDGSDAVALVGLGRFLVSGAARLVVLSSRRTALVGGLSVLAGGTALVAVAGDTTAVLAAVALLSAGEGAFDPVADDLVTASAPTAVRGRVVALLEVGETGAVAAPVVVGAVLAASSFRTTFLVAGLLVATAASATGDAVGRAGPAADSGAGSG